MVSNFDTLRDELQERADGVVEAIGELLGRVGGSI